MKNLENLLKILLENKIEFVLVGGLAATLHGSSVVTQDLDVCCSLSPDNIKKLKTCLAPYHPVHRMMPQKLSFLDIPKEGESLRNLYLETDLGVLDVLGSITGIGDFKTVTKQSIEVELFGVPCRVLSMEALIKAKDAMGRDKDKAVIKELTIIKQKLNL